MRLLGYISLILMLVCCTNTRKLQEEIEVKEDLSPAWVKSRPISSFEYIGIGKATKRGAADEYQKMARNNALNDLASEIEVNVSSNSLLYTLEHDDRFSESYTQSIMTSSDLKLEGFEVTDSYEDDSYYWVYYKLNKATYEEIKAQWKKEALSRAEQYLTNARSARKNGDVTTAAGHFLEVLNELQAYWGESNTLEVTSGEEGVTEFISVDKVALEEFAEMRSSYRLRSNVDIVQLDETNEFRFPIEVTSELDGELSSAVPFIQRNGAEERIRSTANHINVLARPGQKSQSIFSVSADPFEEIRKQVRKSGLKFMESMLDPEIILIDIFTVYPSVTLHTRQQGLDGGIGGSTILRSALIQSLSELDIEVDENNQSPYFIDLSAISRDGGTAQSFQVVYTDVTILSGNSESGNTASSARLESVKGVHNNELDASNISLRKCAEKIDEELLKPLVSAMF